MHGKGLGTPNQTPGKALSIFHGDKSHDWALHVYSEWTELWPECHEASSQSSREMLSNINLVQGTYGILNFSNIHIKNTNKRLDVVMHTCNNSLQKCGGRRITE
jgi:hypothetical protein